MVRVRQFAKLRKILDGNLLGQVRRFAVIISAQNALMELFDALFTSL